MIKSHLIPIAMFFSVFSLASCLDDLDTSNTIEEELEEGYLNVDERLWAYYDIFEEEGRKRGLNIDLKSARISGDIDAIDENNVIGTCQYGGFTADQIIVDDLFWSRASNIGREFVVFHELGHCFLHRDHLEDSTSDGLCVSLMRSGTGGCRDAYNTNNRAYYLDELFSQETN